MTHTAAELLGTIRDLWPELDTTPTGRRRDIPRTLTAEQRERRLERWEDELTDKLAGAIGRGASPAPCDLDQLQAKIDASVALCELADRVAAHVQPSAPPTEVGWYWHVSLIKGRLSRWRIRATTPDPGHWDYSHRHGAPWAVTWLLGALDDGVPTLVADDITDVARHVARMLRVAVDGQTEYPAGRCPTCKTGMTVADWDDVINCPGCGATYGRRLWLDFRRTR